LPTSIKIPMNEVHRDFLFSFCVELAQKHKRKQKIPNARQRIWDFNCSRGL